MVVTGDSQTRFYFDIRLKDINENGYSGYVCVDVPIYAVPLARNEQMSSFFESIKS